MSRIAGTVQKDVQLVGWLEMWVGRLFIVDVLFVFGQKVECLADAPEHDDEKDDLVEFLTNGALTNRLEIVFMNVVRDV